MSQGTVNYSNNNIDLTVRVFDTFYGYDVNVPANEYDLVNSFFLSVMDDARTAGNMTVSLFQVADQTKVPVLTLLDTMKGRNQIDISLNMAYFLNNIRSRTTLLGVNAASTPNYYAARLVMQ